MESAQPGGEGREKRVFELVLCFPIGKGGRSDSVERISAGHVPQMGSTLNIDGGRRSGSWKVEHIGQTVADGVLKNEIHVYLEESD